MYSIWQKKRTSSRARWEASTHKDVTSLDGLSRVFDNYVFYITLRIKEQETRLTLHEQDDDDDIALLLLLVLLLERMQ